MAAREEEAASKRKAEEAEEDSSAAALQMADKTVSGPAAAAEVDGCSDDDEDDSFIRNLNLISKRNLMPAEWIENARKLYYERIASYNRVYDALESGDIESDDEAGTAEYEEWSKQHWAAVRLRGLNIAGDGSRGVDAVAVPFRLNPPEEEEEEDHGAAAAESSS